MAQRKTTVCLGLPDRKMSTDPVETRKHEGNVYADLFREEVSDMDAATETYCTNDGINIERVFSNISGTAWDRTF